jgi:hypothetical protein
LIAVVLGVAVSRIGERDAAELIVTIQPLGEVARSFSLDRLKSFPALSRRGTYQNQYGNWRDEGIYTGVRLVDLIGEEAEYERIRVVAEDGYEVQIERWRVEDPGYPIVLAYAFEGQETPAWLDGPRIAVLPEDGTVGNEEYGVDSAGSYWVKSVERIILQTAPMSGSTH